MLKRSAQWGGPGSVTPDASLPSRNGGDAVEVAAGQKRAEKTKRKDQQKRKETAEERNEAEKMR